MYSENEGFVNIGTSYVTSEFAVNSIRTWWYEMGIDSYANAKKILITADCGGSNGYRVRLFQVELQKLADEIQMVIYVRNDPPGTSKLHKIEHRMFCHISKNFCYEPLTTKEKVLKLIENTKTKTGLRIKARLDSRIYQKGIEITDKELELVQIKISDFHGEWNYQIEPKNMK